MHTALCEMYSNINNLKGNGRSLVSLHSSIQLLPPALLASRQQAQRRLRARLREGHCTCRSSEGCVQTEWDVSRSYPMLWSLPRACVMRPASICLSRHCPKVAQWHTCRAKGMPHARHVAVNCELQAMVTAKLIFGGIGSGTLVTQRRLGSFLTRQNQSWRRWLACFERFPRSLAKAHG